MNTTTTATQPTGTDTDALDPADFRTEVLGEGNYLVDAPNGMWEITADTAETPGLTEGEGVSFLVTGPNHHHPDHWADTLDTAIAHVRQYGVDRRTTRQS